MLFFKIDYILDSFYNLSLLYMIPNPGRAAPCRVYCRDVSGIELQLEVLSLDYRIFYMSLKDELYSVDYGLVIIALHQYRISHFLFKIRFLSCFGWFFFFILRLAFWFLDSLYISLI